MIHTSNLDSRGNYIKSSDNHGVAPKETSRKMIDIDNYFLFVDPTDSQEAIAASSQLSEKGVLRLVYMSQSDMLGVGAALNNQEYWMKNQIAASRMLKEQLTLNIEQSNRMYELEEENVKLREQLK